MSAEEWISALLAYGILAVITVAANYADREKHTAMRRAVVVSLILTNVLMVSVYGIMQVASANRSGAATADADIPTSSEAWGALITSSVVAVLATAILFRRVRTALSGSVFPSYRGDRKRKQPETEDQSAQPLATEARPGPKSSPGGEPLFPQMLNYYTTDSLARWSSTAKSISARSEVYPPIQSKARGYRVRGFNPDSTVHLVALAFCIYLLGTQLVMFVLEGGLSGIAESYAEEGMSAESLLANGLPLVVVPFLGAGMLLRRSFSEVLGRLGLERPSLEGLAAASGMVVALLVFVMIAAGVWESMVSEETFEEQNEASNELADSIGTIWMALLLAATAAVSEEIAFRGALQPVLGFWATAVIFASTHIQYTLTPAALLILVVAIGFGWLRQRYNTTVCIVAHFFYNFIPLAIAVSLPEEAFMWLLH